MPLTVFLLESYSIADDENEYKNMFFIREKLEHRVETPVAWF